MKSIKELQNLIKEKTKFYILIDYEDVITNFFDKYEKNLFSTRYVRILQNFAKCDFININIITISNLKTKHFKKLQNLISDAEFCQCDMEFVETLDAKFHNTYIPFYLGDNIDVINKVKELNGITISINPLNKKTKKMVDFQIPKSKFEEILIETNNICL